jgi:acyl carrier protein
MVRADIENKIYEISEKLFRDQKVVRDDQTDFVQKFQMTSIDVLEFLLAIEMEYDFEFDDEYLVEATLRNIDILKDYVENRLKGRIVS